jgi:hypothetical protein
MYRIWNVVAKAYTLEPGKELESYFFSKDIAQDSADALTLATNQKHLVHDMDWARRERNRLSNGEYKAPVWSRRGFWQNRSSELIAHYAHVSQKNAELIAYTMDETKGRLDVQTAIKPGAYLQRFFADVLSAEEIKNLANLHTMAARGEEEIPTLNFATTPDDIVAVYRDGPSSCMDGSRSKWTRVYGAGDLAIAYTGERNAAEARALCWQEQKIYGRVYPGTDSFCGSEAEREAGRALIRALEQAGFSKATSGAFNGARLLKLTNSNGNHVMPYLDNGYGVIDGGKFWKMAEFGDYSCQSTEGTFEEDENQSLCECCHDYVNEDDTCEVYVARRSSETWCGYCTDEHAFYCHAVHSHVSNSSGTEVDSRRVAEWVAEDCGYCEHDSEYTRNELAEVVVSVGRYGEDLEQWRTCYLKDETFLCTVTGKRYVLDLAAPETLKEIRRDATDTFEGYLVRWEAIFKGVDGGQATYHSADPDQLTLVA